MGSKRLMVDDVIEALNLRENARQGAYILKSKRGDIVFISGRRTRSQQARAMAQNVMTDFKWIQKTYRINPISKACQEWVDYWVAHYPQPTQTDIELGF